MRDVTLVILNSLRIKCHIRRPLTSFYLYLNNLVSHLDCSIPVDDFEFKTAVFLPVSDLLPLMRNGC